MSKSVEMKNIRRNIWVSAGIIGIIQYSSAISAILVKNKWPSLVVLLPIIGYGIGVTFYYQQEVTYLYPNCQHISSPFLRAIIKAKRIVTTCRSECPNCHETHYCIEVPKTHMSIGRLEISHI